MIRSEREAERSDGIEGEKKKNEEVRNGNHDALLSTGPPGENRIDGESKMHAHGAPEKNGHQPQKERKDDKERNGCSSASASSHPAEKERDEKERRREGTLQRKEEERVERKRRRELGRRRRRLGTAWNLQKDNLETYLEVLGLDCFLSEAVEQAERAEEERKMKRRRRRNKASATSPTATKDEKGKNTQHGKRGIEMIVAQNGEICKSDGEEKEKVEVVDNITLCGRTVWLFLLWCSADALDMKVTIKMRCTYSQPGVIVRCMDSQRWEVYIHTQASIHPLYERKWILSRCDQ